MEGNLAFSTKLMTSHLSELVKLEQENRVASSLQKQIETISTSSSEKRGRPKSKFLDRNREIVHRRRGKTHLLKTRGGLFSIFETVYYTEGSCKEGGETVFRRRDEGRKWESRIG